jgi:hypothetical protein
MHLHEDAFSLLFFVSSVLWKGMLYYGCISMSKLALQADLFPLKVVHVLYFLFLLAFYSYSKKWRSL